MKKMNFFPAAVLLVSLIFSGCRSNQNNDLPEVKPLPEDNTVRITMDVNISDGKTAAANSVPKVVTEEKKQASVKAAKNDPPKNRIIMSEHARREVKAKTAKRKRIEFVPSGVGLIDANLNEVEQSYVKEVRRQNSRQESASADAVFGSFKPVNWFKPAE